MVSKCRPTRHTQAERTVIRRLRLQSPISWRRASRSRLQPDLIKVFGARTVFDMMRSEVGVIAARTLSTLRLDRRRCPLGARARANSRPVIVDREPTTSSSWSLVRVRRVLGEVVGRDQASVLRLEPAPPVRRCRVADVGVARQCAVAAAHPMDRAHIPPLLTHRLTTRESGGTLGCNFRLS
jgi:hypothetical protein